MAHATIIDLASRLAWSDLAEAAAPDVPAVDGEALRAYQADGTVSAGVEEGDLERAAGRIERALEDASSEVDGYLAGRYGTLATPVPDVVVTRTLDVAAFRLLGGDRETDRYQVWRAAVSWLMAVADGKVDLYPPTEAEGDVRYTSRPSEFSRESLRGL